MIPDRRRFHPPGYASADRTARQRGWLDDAGEPPIPREVGERCSWSRRPVHMSAAAQWQLRAAQRTMATGRLLTSAQPRLASDKPGRSIALVRRARPGTTPRCLAGCTGQCGAAGCVVRLARSVTRGESDVVIDPHARHASSEIRATRALNRRPRVRLDNPMTGSRSCIRLAHSGPATRENYR